MMRLIGKQTLDRPAGATVTQFDGGAFHPNRDLFAPIPRVVAHIAWQQGGVKFNLATGDHIHARAAAVGHGAFAGMYRRFKRGFAFLQARDFSAGFSQFVSQSKFMHHIRYPGYLFFHLSDAGLTAAEQRASRRNFCKGRANPYGLHEDSSKNRKDRQK